MKILKAILLLSAFLAVTLRLLTYQDAQFLGDKTVIFDTIAFVSMGVCLVCALIWVVILKKEEKANKAKENQENND